MALNVETYTFASRPGGELALDVYRATAPSAVAIYLHGGGFVGGTRGMDAARMRAMSDHGVTVIAADYRLAPDWTFPAQVDDVRAAIDWARGHGDDVGTDASRVALWGASAGAVLAAIAALAPAEPGTGATPASGAVSAAVCWFGFSDIRTAGSQTPVEAAHAPTSPALLLIGRDSLRGADPALVSAASPVTHVHRQAPPFLIAHGDQDHIIAIGESERLHRALVDVGAESTLMTVGGAGHEDPRFDGPAAIAMTAAFIRAHAHQKS